MKSVILRFSFFSQRGEEKRCEEKERREKERKARRKRWRWRREPSASCCVFHADQKSVAKIYRSFPFPLPFLLLLVSAQHTCSFSSSSMRVLSSTFPRAMASEASRTAHRK
eukprot:746074-Hanusia_phi.AAC.2